MRADEKSRRGRAPETRSPDVEEIRRLVEPVVEDEGFELLDLVYAGGRARGVLRLVLDHPTAPVTVGDCSRVSGAVGRLLDGLDVISGRYHLEVSSPGADRILRKDRDFLRFRGSLVRVSLSAPLAGGLPEAGGSRKNFSGRLTAYDPEEQTLLLEMEEGPIRIPRSRISRVRIQPEFPVPARPGKGPGAPKRLPRRGARN